MRNTCLKFIRCTDYLLRQNKNSITHSAFISKISVQFTENKTVMALQFTCRIRNFLQVLKTHFSVIFTENSLTVLQYMCNLQNQLCLYYINKYTPYILQIFFRLNRQKILLRNYNDFGAYE